MTDHVLRIKVSEMRDENRHLGARLVSQVEQIIESVMFEEAAIKGAVDAIDTAVDEYRDAIRGALMRESAWRLIM